MSLNQYRNLLEHNNFAFIPLNVKNKGFYFAEDKTYWVDKIKKQESQTNIEDYDYAFLIRFELDADLINEWMEDPIVARFSPKIQSYYEALGKIAHIQLYREEDENILCLLDIYESKETIDGIAQLWMLQANIESALWMLFIENISKIECVGEIPEAAKFITQEG